MNTPAWHRRSTRLLMAALTATLVAVGVAAAADAHDVLVSTSPANGAHVATVPPSVVLRFNETVLGIGTEVAVSGPNGPVQQGKAVVVDNTVTERLQAGAPAGTYTVNWRATSVDGHPVSGTFSFTATAAGKGTASSSAAPTSPASSTSASRAASTGSSAPWPLVAVSVVLVLVAIAAWAWSRRRSARPARTP